MVTPTCLAYGLLYVAIRTSATGSPLQSPCFFEAYVPLWSARRRRDLTDAFRRSVRPPRSSRRTWATTGQVAPAPGLTLLAALDCTWSSRSLLLAYAPRARPPLYRWKATITAWCRAPVHAHWPRRWHTLLAALGSASARSPRTWRALRTVARLSTCRTASHPARAAATRTPRFDSIVEVHLRGGSRPASNLGSPWSFLARSACGGFRASSNDASRCTAPACRLVCLLFVALFIMT